MWFSVVVAVSKKYVVGLILNHYDANEDDLLTAREIYDAIALDKIKALSDSCSFFDILRIYDSNKDKMLNAEEMNDAFGKNMRDCLSFIPLTNCDFFTFIFQSVKLFQSQVISYLQKLQHLQEWLYLYRFSASVPLSVFSTVFETAEMK